RWIPYGTAVPNNATLLLVAGIDKRNNGKRWERLFIGSRPRSREASAIQRATLVPGLPRLR
ncbi:MAG: hypothetical protein LBQ54_01560, partial [Planctomycetaceae bacterium]|nr:hypothetical protein [Planctomycetaceae bacterium]